MPQEKRFRVFQFLLLFQYYLNLGLSLTIGKSFFCPISKNISFAINVKNKVNISNIIIEYTLKKHCSEYYQGKCMETLDFTYFTDLDVTIVINHFKAVSKRVAVRRANCLGAHGLV